MALTEGDVNDPEAMARTSERGLARLDEALAIYRDLGDRRGEARVLWTIGTGYTYIGDFAASERFLAQAADIAADSGDLFHAGWATYMRAGIAGRNGDIDGAAAHVRRALEMFASVRDVTGMLLCIDEIGYGMTMAGRIADGLRLSAAAAAFERRHGGSYIAVTRGLTDRPDPHDAVGDDAVLAAAWAEGEALSLEEAAALAIDLIDEGGWRVPA